MVVARLSVWKFRRGQREGASGIMKNIIEKARNTEGFRGHIFLLSKEDPDSETVVSLWEDEEAMRASMEGLFQEAIRDLEQYISGPPGIERFRVQMADVPVIMPWMARPM